VIALLFQAATAVLAVAFAVLALRVTRAAVPGDQPLHHRAWVVAGLAFAIAGASSVAQNAAAVWAFRAGEGSVPWDLFLAWAPRGNYGRACLKIAMALVLVALARLAGVAPRRLGWGVSALFVAMLGAGAVLGWAEGPLRAAIHYPGYAVFEVAELVALLLALFVGITASTMDRWLWAALGVYAARQALNVLSWTALAWLGVEGQWSLDPRVLHSFGVAGYLAMIAIAVHRLRLARRGVRVPGMFDLTRTPVSTFH